MKARNSVGYSLDSDVISVIAASLPDVPTNLITTIDGENVLISWTPASNGGSPLTSYVILVQGSSGDFFEDTTNCDGSTQTIINNNICTVPQAALQTSPFDLTWGDHVFAKVKAINVVGESAFSELGNGAHLITLPDKPINLADNTALTDKT